MRSGQRLTASVLVRWIGRWGYFGALVPMVVLVLIGLRGSQTFALETPIGFARYMLVILVLALGVGVGRPVNRAIHDRFAPWVAAGGVVSGWRYRFVALGPRFITFVVVAAALALLVSAKTHGLWPWRE